MLRAGQPNLPVSRFCQPGIRATAGSSRACFVCPLCGRAIFKGQANTANTTSIIELVLDFDPLVLFININAELG